MKLRKLSLEELPPILLAITGVLGIGPMAVLRASNGSYLYATIDTMAVIGFVCVIWLAYVKRRIRAASVCMACVAIALVVAKVTLRGPHHIFWTYPVTVALFYLLKPREAAFASLVAIAAIFPVILGGRELAEIAIVLVSLAVTIALSVAFAALTNEQRRELQVMSLVDPLTGSGNRRALDHTLDRAMNTANTHGQSFFMIILDIDHFKSINDVHGHAVGDEVLCDVAATVRANIRPTDSCYRAGGEEFVVVAATADVEQAKALAERLRIAISDTALSPDSQVRSLAVTASFGLARYAAGESRDALYRRADGALYEAKRSGRNRLKYSAHDLDADADADAA